MVVAVMTDLWVHTEEPISSPKSYLDARLEVEIMAARRRNKGRNRDKEEEQEEDRGKRFHLGREVNIGFDIGLWKVCPKVEWNLGEDEYYALGELT